MKTSLKFGFNFGKSIAALDAQVTLTSHYGPEHLRCQVLVTGYGAATFKVTSAIRMASAMALGTVSFIVADILF